jgi:hypothetical protein
MKVFGRNYEEKSDNYKLMGEMGSGKRSKAGLVKGSS